MAVSEWYDKFSSEVVEQRDLERRLESTWIEYDSTVDSIEGSRREHLKQISKKHNVSHLDVLEWHEAQSFDK